MLSRVMSSAAFKATSIRNMATITGKVKWFNVAKGFGFISPVDQSKDVFVHQSNINSTGFRFLREGEEVSYEPISTDRGTTATKVSKPDGSPIVRAEGERA